MRVCPVVVALSIALGCGATTSATDTDTDTDASTSGSSSSSSGTPAPVGSTGSGMTSHGSGEETTIGGGSTGTGEPLVDPRATGPHEVEMLELDIETPGGLSMAVTVHLPTDGGPYPVVVLLAGFLLGSEDYASYGSHLGSWGYTVVMPELPGGDQSDDRDAVVELLDWLEGPGALEGAALGGRADASSLMLSGHSRGGKIAFLTATADARADAIFAIDPVDTAGGPGSMPSPQNPSVAPELMPLVLAPMAIVGETVNASGTFMACAPEDENFRQFFAAASAPAAAIEFLTANHMSFLDNPNCGLTCSACPSGTDDPAVTRRMTQGYMVAFAQWQLDGVQGYRDFLVGPFTQPDVDAGLVTIDTIGGF